MPLEADQAPDFLRTLKDILDIPGVAKKQIADWAGVDPSSVTRWYQGVTPNNPVDILRRLAPHVEKARKDAVQVAASVKRTEVESWRNLVGDMDPGLRQHVTQTGLLASTYYVFMIWDPRSVENHECDIVIMRYFHNVWADMSRRLYNIGDITQTVSIDEHPGEREAPFDQQQPIGGNVTFDLRWEEQLAGFRDSDGRSEDGPGGRRALASMCVQLNLTGLKSKGDVIAVISDFGYRYRAKKAVVDGRANRGQTNEFLGAPIVFPCRRFRLVVCVPRLSVVGSPSALSYSNRAMLPLLLELDKAKPEAVESFMWPLGRRFELSSAPDAQLKTLPHFETLIDDLPPGLQQALSQPLDSNEPHESLQQILCDSRSACFLLDIHQPHPSLIHTIVWRLSDVDVS